jgi:hypothetical protein
MSFNPGSKFDKARQIGLIIWYIWVLGSAALTTSLFIEGRVFPAIGWTSITFVSIFIIVLEKYLRQKEIRWRNYGDQLTKNRTNVQTKYMEDFDVLLSSKDPVKVYSIKDVLSSHNIECVVLDSHSAQMMGFLPDVNMRVMVRHEDYAGSVKILDSIKELKEPNTNT